MNFPAAALANLFFLLDLPTAYRVGQIGLHGTPLSRALEATGADLVNLDNNHMKEAIALDLLLVQGELDPAVWLCLRPGTWVLQFRDYRVWGRRGILPRRGGKSDSMHWLVSPDLSEPLSVIPNTRKAMLAHERITREPGWKRIVRLGAISLGWRPRHFASEVIGHRIL